MVTSLFLAVAAAEVVVVKVESGPWSLTLTCRADGP